MKTQSKCLREDQVPQQCAKGPDGHGNGEQGACAVLESSPDSQDLHLKEAIQNTHAITLSDSEGQHAASGSQLGTASGPKRKKTYVARKNVLSAPGRKGKVDADL